MVKIVPWVNGSGNITLSYNGQGDGQIVINTDPNDLTVPRSQIIEVTARDKSKQFTVNQLAKQINPYVDLGLPSGLLWARGNIVKVDGSYTIGEPSDYGCYFSWGNIDGHNDGDGYNFGTSNSGPYASTPGAVVNTNISPTDAVHDAALACIGGSWHMPAKEDFQELYSNTDHEWTTIDDISGCKFMKKNDHSVYVFIPLAGRAVGTSIYNIGSQGRYWSSSLSSPEQAYFMRITGSSVTPNDVNYRCDGYTIRAVRSSN